MDDDRAQAHMSIGKGGRTMAKNVLGLFENPSDAQAAVRDLERAGCSGTNVSVMQTASDRLSSSFQKQHGLPAGIQVYMAVWLY